MVISQLYVQDMDTDRAFATETDTDTATRGIEKKETRFFVKVGSLLPNVLTS
jgi:hypothetical protein